jgi:hypothetical protein
MNDPSLICLVVPREDIAVAAVSSGLKKNTTLRELTLEVSQGATTVSPILISLRNHPRLRSLCLRGDVGDLTGLETLLQSDNSKITELEIHRYHNEDLPIMGLMHVLQALGRYPALTKLGLRYCALGRDEARLLGMVLSNTPSIQSLDLAFNYLGGAGLADLAPALIHNTSIKVLDLSGNSLWDMESAELLRGILHSNKTLATLGLSWNWFGEAIGVVECIVEGLGSNSTLMTIDLARCALGDDGVSILAQTLGSQNTTLQNFSLDENSITSNGVGVLLDTMEQSSHITDLELRHDHRIGSEEASLLARSLGNSALPNLTRLSLPNCQIGDDGFIALVSALEQNTSLLHLDLRFNPDVVSERAFLALAESLPKTKVLQGVDLSWCTGLATTMPLLLAGLCKNTSLFHFHVTGCAARSAVGCMEEMERYGYRNRCLSLIRAQPRGVWSHALARVVAFPDVIFEMLCSEPSLVPSDLVRLPG